MPIIQALDRALKIVDLFTEATPLLKITEISERMGLHKSTVHSLLKTLQLHGYIDQDADSGKYRLGLTYLVKSGLLLGSMDIRTAALPYLKKVSSQTGQTVHLVILDGREGVYIEKVEGELAAIRYSRIGRRVPLHSSAVGKVLIAFREQEALVKLLSGYDFTAQTKYTITDYALFLNELAKVRSRGYAVDDQENELGVRCAAVPVRGYGGGVAAAISISTMVVSVSEEELEGYVRIIQSAADEISSDLGFRS
ncbi:MAG: iclR helix-turn-helix domain protein [Paenibacillus sp.]|jgi:DNA-binding IclR family transcriptional regulator|nr:iclR helix-turn-helix domain protein [Paenibacillus sp.]